MPPARPTSRLLVVATLLALVPVSVASADDGPTTATTPTIPATGPTTPTIPTAAPTGATTGTPPEPSGTTPTLAPTSDPGPATEGAGPTIPTAPVASTPLGAVPVGPAAPTAARRRTPRRGPVDLITVDPRATGPAHIEVDISAQRLYLYRGRSLYRTLHVSTGSGRRYCVQGDCAVARTPRGRFRVYTRISGWRKSRLGQLYNPLYFNGGYAIHGAGSVPSYPASHGCVRISMANARWLPSAVPNGTPVWVHD